MTSVTTPDELRAAKTEMGLSSAALAEQLRLGLGAGKTVRRWLNGTNPIPGPVQVAVELLLAAHRRRHPVKRAA